MTTRIEGGIYSAFRPNPRGGEAAIARRGAMRFVMLLAAILAVNVTTAQAQPAISWYFHPNTAAMDDCYGNCGAGCSGTLEGGLPAPCGGNHYWTWNVLGPITRTGDQETQEVCGPGSVMWIFYYDLYSSPGTYTYHGHTTLGCRRHDAICRGGTWAECIALAYIGLDCVEGRDRDWSYNDTLIGITSNPVSWVRTRSRCWRE